MCHIKEKRGPPSLHCASVLCLARGVTQSAPAPSTERISHLICNHENEMGFLFLLQHRRKCVTVDFYIGIKLINMTDLKPELQPYGWM